jgi:hypothetical protein
MNEIQDEIRSSTNSLDLILGQIEIHEQNAEFLKSKNLRIESEAELALAEGFRKEAVNLAKKMMDLMDSEEIATWPIG